jgi:hypothetical protein
MATVERKHLQLVQSLSQGSEPRRDHRMIDGWYISPHGYNLYQVDPGDTLASIAASYLGDQSRAGEISALQSAAWLASRTVNGAVVVRAGDQLYMPQEAVDAAKRIGQVTSGAGAASASTQAAINAAAAAILELPATPAPGGGGGGAIKPVPPAAVAKIPVTKILMIGGGVVAGLAVLAGGVVAVAGGHHKKLLNPRKKHGWHHHHRGEA